MHRKANRKLARYRSSLVISTATDNPALQAGPATSFTFTGAALGSAASRRITQVLVNTHTAVATAVTVGGLSATKAVEEITGVSGLQFWYVDSSSLGATANIIVSAGSNMTDVAIFVSKITGSTSAPTSFGSANTGSTSPASIAVTVPANGACSVGVCLSQFVQDVVGWSSATQDYSSPQTVGGNVETLTLAHTTTSGTPSYAYGPDTAIFGSHIISISWGP